MRAWAGTGTRQVAFLARWAANKSMQHARDRIRQFADRSGLLLSVEWIVQDIMQFRRGWAGYITRHLYDRDVVRARVTEPTASPKLVPE